MIVFFITDVPHRLQQKNSPLVNGLPRRFYFLLGILAIFGLGNFNRTLLLLRIQNTLQHTHSLSATLSFITLLYIFRNLIQTLSAYSMGALSDRIGRTVPLSIGGFGFFGLLALSLIYPQQAFSHHLPSSSFQALAREPT